MSLLIMTGSLGGGSHYFLFWVVMEVCFSLFGITGYKLGFWNIFPKAAGMEEAWMTWLENSSKPTSILETYSSSTWNCCVEFTAADYLGWFDLGLVEKQRKDRVLCAWHDIWVVD